MAQYKYLAVLDFEATCWDGSDEHEIIEFPTVIVDIESGKVIDKLEQFVKPSKISKLSDFCKQLTSIKQEQVDSGISLQEALDTHYRFIQKYTPSILVTCGDWDLKTMLPKDAMHNKINVPNYYNKWINIKIPFHMRYFVKKLSMTIMLAHLNLKLMGTHHRGIDDCQNIAQIAIKMLADGWNPEITGKN